VACSKVTTFGGTNIQSTAEHSIYESRRKNGTLYTAKFIFNVQAVLDCLTVEVGPIGCPETSVTTNVGQVTSPERENLNAAEAVMELQGGTHQGNLRRNVILFVPCTVTTITHIQQYIHN